MKLTSEARVAVTGATGLIGSALVETLRREGMTVHRVTRSPAEAGGNDIVWQPRDGRIDTGALEGVAAVVHLAGENVGERWTAEKKRRIRESRIDGTGLLARALAGLERPPAVLVSASAVGIYGDRGDEVLDESSATGDGFLAEVGRAWEAATEPAARAGIRVVHARFGVVLSPRGGALNRMLLPFRIGVGGRLGSGRQWMSWISLPDAVRAVRFALDEAAVSGPINVTAPNPATNEEFTRALGRALGRPTLFPAPAMALRLAFGEMADEALLASQRAVPRRLQQADFAFEHPDLDAALDAVLRDD
jgi:uncharacterized protein